MKRTMTGRALTVEMRQDAEIDDVKLFVDIMLSEDETDIDEVGQDWTVFISLARHINDAEFNITEIKCVFHNDTFMPMEVLTHVSEHYEMIVDMVNEMIESGETKKYSIEYDENDDDENDDDV